MLDVLEVVAKLLLALVVFGALVGTIGPMLAAVVVLPAMAVFGPLAACSQLRRQNQRMYGLLDRREPSAAGMLGGVTRRSWWSYRHENLLLQGELRGRGLDLPSALPGADCPGTRSERVHAWLDPSTGSTHIIAAALLALGVFALAVVY